MRRIIPHIWTACQGIRSRVRSQEPAVARTYPPKLRGAAAEREKLNVSPVVNIQSGAARLIPRRTPASMKTFFHGASQIKPTRAELSGVCFLTASPLISPTNLNFEIIG